VLSYFQMQCKHKREKDWWCLIFRRTPAKSVWAILLSSRNNCLILSFHKCLHSGELDTMQRHQSKVVRTCLCAMHTFGACILTARLTWGCEGVWRAQHLRRNDTTHARTHIHYMQTHLFLFFSPSDDSSHPGTTSEGGERRRTGECERRHNSGEENAS